MPRWPMPAPKRISATPAASASFTRWTGRPSTRSIAVSASKSTQPGSTFAALLVMPSMTTAGKPTPTGTRSSSSTSAVIFLTIRAIDAMTAAGADGCGVGTRWRSPSSSPVSRFTAAALIPLPPTSTPIATRRCLAATGPSSVSLSALSHSPSTSCSARAAAFWAIFAVFFGSGASSRHGLPAPPPSASVAAWASGGVEWSVLTGVLLADGAPVVRRDGSGSWR